MNRYTIMFTYRHAHTGRLTGGRRTVRARSEDEAKAKLRNALGNALWSINRVAHVV